MMQELVVNVQKNLSLMFIIPLLIMQEMFVGSVQQWSLSCIPKLMLQLKMDIWVCEYIVL